MIEAIVREGPPMDGVTPRGAATTNGLAMNEHRAMMQSILAAVRQHPCS